MEVGGGEGTKDLLKIKRVKDIIKGFLRVDNYFFYDVNNISSHNMTVVKFHTFI